MTLRGFVWLCGLLGVALILAGPVVIGSSDPMMSIVAAVGTWLVIVAATSLRDMRRSARRWAAFNENLRESSPR